ncbi:MAG TPA: hypothetical protein VFB99_24380 [Vicinamibacterales bacterium]|nr:hypothetical protein [Vicinamibacterales bacterium]
MPDFTARPTAGFTVEIWEDAEFNDPDPPAGLYPSRINPLPGAPHRYYRVITGSLVTIKATVGGVEGPLDAALGGRLFTSSFGEWPIWPTGGLPAISSPAGQTSVATFTPLVGGHLLFTMRRTDGGAVLIPLYAIVL